MSNFIEWDLIDVKGKTKGVKKTLCPSCSAERKKKNDPCLYVNLDSGVAKCFNCEVLSFRDSVEFETKKGFDLPNPNWSNYTKLSDNMVKWLEKRRISQNTAIALNVTEEKHYMPQTQKEENCIVFNYFEGSILVNKKYRDARKNFTQSKNTKSIFYNINSILGQDECYIVEGEFDVLALYEIGIKNAISVPNGANDNDEQWKHSKKYLQGVKRFIIATDNDEKGILLREKIAQRLGRYNCSYVEFKGKDANEDLITLDLEQSIKNVKKFPVSGTFQVSDLMEGILDLYDNGLPKTLYPKNICFGELKNIFSVMRGQLTTITGIPSHGKSNFNDWYVLNLVNDYNMKASWFSPEHSPLELYQTNLIEKVTGRQFWGENRISKEAIEVYKEWANEKIYLTACDEGSPTWEWLLEKFKEQMYSFGIDIFVIDAFNKVLLPKGNRLEVINDVLTKLTHFAQSNNVLIFLVAHPTKMQKNQDGIYNVPTLYDVSGSADFRNQTHNGYTIYRYFETECNDPRTEFINTKTKFSFQGKMTESVSFQYDIKTGRYFANGIIPNFDMTRKREYVDMPIINDDEFDYTPF